MMPEKSHETSTVVQVGNQAPYSQTKDQGSDPDGGSGNGFSGLFVTLGIIFLLIAVSKNKQEAPTPDAKAPHLMPREIGDPEAMSRWKRLSRISPKIADRLKTQFDRYFVDHLTLSGAIALAEIDYKHDSRFDPLMLGSAIAIADGNRELLNVISHSISTLGLLAFIREMHQVSSQVCFKGGGDLPLTCAQSMCIKDEDFHLLEEGKSRPFNFDTRSAH